MSKPPTWMESLIDVVGDCMEPHNHLGPLAYRWRNEDDYWEAWVYPTPGELLGGAEDGTVVLPGFSLDVRGLSAAFSRLNDVNWQAQPLGPHDQDAPYISLEGVYEGHEVSLFVLSQAPDDEEPGFRVDLTTGRIEP